MNVGDDVAPLLCTPYPSSSHPISHPVAVDNQALAFNLTPAFSTQPSSEKCMTGQLGSNSVLSKQETVKRRSESSVDYPSIHHNLKKRPRRLSSSQSKSPVETPHRSHTKMFSTRKYSPLPTSTGAQRKRAQGAISWKKWAIVGTFTLILFGLGWSYTGSPKEYDAGWELESESSEVDSG